MRGLATVVLAACLGIAVGCGDDEEEAASSGAGITLGERGIEIRGENGERVEVGGGGVNVEGGEGSVNVGGGGVNVEGGEGSVNVGGGGVNVEGGEGSVNVGGGGPIRCSGGDSVVRSNAVINGGVGPAIHAEQACSVTCNNCTLSSNSVAVLAENGAQVTLNNCTVRGQRSLVAENAATIIANGGSREGDTQKASQATITIN